jgi:hypothetical protein
MRTKNPERFLKITAFALGLAILAGGTVLSEKNAALFGEFDARSIEASVVATVESPIGKCAKVGRGAVVTLLGVGDNMKIYATKKSDLKNILANQKFEFTEAISTALTAGSISLVEIEENREYEFTVQDGEPEFWQCVIAASELFENVTIVGENFFTTDNLLIKSEEFAKAFADYGYHFGAISRVPKFIDLVELPDSIAVAKRTAYFFDRPFVQVFEIELNSDIDYLNWKKAIIAKLGNLNYAAFGENSTYSSWDKKAATFFHVEKSSEKINRVVAFVYDYNVFRHARRAFKSVAENFLGWEIN